MALTPKQQEDTPIYIFGKSTTEAVIQQGRVRNMLNPPKVTLSNWRDCKGDNTGKIKTCGCAEHRKIMRVTTEEVLV